MDNVSDNSKKKKPLNKRGLTTFLLFLISVIISFSGILLFISPKKYAPIWARGLMCGLEKDQWEEIHILFALLFIIVVIVHLCLNWHVFRNYIKSRIREGLNLRRELAIACIIVAIFMGGTIMQLPPLHTVIKTRKIIKDYFKEYEKQHKTEVGKLENKDAKK